VGQYRIPYSAIPGELDSLYRYHTIEADRESSSLDVFNRYHEGIIGSLPGEDIFDLCLMGESPSFPFKHDFYHILPYGMMFESIMK